MSFSESKFPQARYEPRLSRMPPGSETNNENRLKNSRTQEHYRVFPETGVKGFVAQEYRSMICPVSPGNRERASILESGKRYERSAPKPSGQKEHIMWQALN